MDADTLSFHGQDMHYCIHHRKYCTVSERSKVPFSEKMEYFKFLPDNKDKASLIHV